MMLFVSIGMQLKLTLKPIIDLLTIIRPQFISNITHRAFYYLHIIHRLELNLAYQYGVHDQRMKVSMLSMQNMKGMIQEVHRQAYLKMC